MFLLKSLELLGLIGLFVQAFSAWIFVAVLASIRGRAPSLRAFQSFLYAFTALALSLTVMGVRFFRVHDANGPMEMWEDGSPVAVRCYAAYMALKVVFAAMLVRGCHQLVDEPEPRWLRWAWLPLAGAFGLLPLVVPEIDPLLIVQAPVMIGGSLLALQPLRRNASRTGLGIVRASLVGLAVTWSMHASALLLPGLPGTHEWMSLNSFADLGVQLVLGIGLVVGLLRESHAKLQAAEQERERMYRQVQEGEKLRALGTVVSGVAHELNNPLTVILAYAEELKAALPSERSVRILAEQAERCQGIVRNLSALAVQAVHPHEEVDLELLMRRVVRGLSPELSAEGRSVRIEPMSGLSVSVDRVGIEQVLANLIVNGLHASPAGGTVTVLARSTPEGVDVCVADEGAGVPAEARERIFEPFFTTKEPGKGTGLGLSIAHAILRGHGGSIRVDVGPHGHGAAFWIRLPVGELLAQPRRERPRISPPRRENGSRLLIVDDEPAVRTVVRRYAEDRGWHVCEVASAEEAIETDLSTFDALLCDLRMPGIGGGGLYDHLHLAHPDLLERVVFITGDLASSESLRFAERLGRPLLGKPFDKTELLARLESAAASAPPSASPTGANV